MNVKFILMFCFAGNLSAGVLFSQDTVFDVQFDNSTLLSVFDDLKARTGYSFTYNRSAVDEQARITVAMQGATLEEILDRVLVTRGYSYHIDSGVVYVIASERRQQQPPVIVSGQVTGRDGQPLVGASVAVEGSTIGTVTDGNGRFTLSLPGPSTIAVSYVGYRTTRVEATVSGRSIAVVLDEEAAGIDEVIVTGYGEVRRSSFTGTATTMTGEELRRITSGNIIAALQVFDPSLRLMENDRMGSDPNTLPEFYVRGRTGVPNVSELDVVQGNMVGGDMSQFALVNNPNLPVFIVDGFQADVTKIYDMDINRIKTITLLKDAAATAMYGSRASNGVVVIETHAPGIGKLRVNYTGTVGVTGPDLSSYDMMNAREAFAAEVAAGFFDVRLEDVTAQAPYTQVAMAREAEYLAKYNQLVKGVDNYWMSKPLRAAVEHKHSVYIEGGVDELRFGLDLNMGSNNGVMKGSSRDRMGAGLTVSYRWNDLTIQNNLTFDHMNSEVSPYGSFADYSRRHPYDDYTDADGEYPRLLNMWGLTGGDRESNPLYNAQTGNYDRSKYKNWTNNLGIIWKITDKLRLDGRLSVSDKQTDRDIFRDPESADFQEGGDWFTKGRKTVSRQEDLNWNANAFLAWNGSIVEDHFLNARVGVEASSFESHFEQTVYRGFPSAKLNSIAYAYMTDFPMTQDNIRRMASLLGMVNYSIADTYLFDASVRMDGSSEFGSRKRWAPFWALGAGLNLHKYGFVRDMEFVDFWRLRATYGETGKLDVQPYASENVYGILFDQWYPTGIGAMLKSMGNNLLTWSKARNIELGMEVGLWQERLFLSAGFYDKVANDNISTVPLPASSGFASYVDNIGKVRNRGVELNLNVKVVRSQDFDLTVIANMAHNKNRIIGISQALRDYNKKVDEHFEDYRTSAANANLYTLLNVLDNNIHLTQPITKFEEGNSLTSIYGMKSLGINPANGREVFLRRDGTITYEWSSAETQKIGDLEPKIQGALYVQARWKDLTLYTSFLYRMGGDKYNHTLVNNVENVNLFRYNADRRVVTDRWQKPGDRTQLKSIKDRYAVTRPTSRFVQKDNTLVFNSFQLGYDFTRSMRRYLEVVGIEVLRASFNMNDVAVMSSIKQERGLEYPFARTFTFTLNATF